MTRRTPSLAVRLAALVPAVLLLLGGWALGSRLLGGAAADPNRFVVLPFEVQGRGTGALLNGDEAASLVTDALTRWTDFGMVSGLTVGSALAAERESLTVRRAATDRGTSAPRGVRIRRFSRVCSVARSACGRRT